MEHERLMTFLKEHLAKREFRDCVLFARGVLETTEDATHHEICYVIAESFKKSPEEVETALRLCN